MLRWSLLTLMLIGLTQPALAWGPKGHEIVASIAEAELSPAARDQLRQIMGGHGAPLASIANWADIIRSERPETAHWHFVDIPLEAAGYDKARDCAADACVVAQITLQAGKLRDHSLPQQARFEALKWVVHFVGDIHQPLHSADNHDRGGNDVPVRFDNETLRLHQVWDSGIIDDLASHADTYASKLSHAITPADRQRWTQSAHPADWANESFRVGKSAIYAPLNLVGHPGKQTMVTALPTDYARQEQATVERQLQRAGVRLAALLNATLGSAGH